MAMTTPSSSLYGDTYSKPTRCEEVVTQPRCAAHPADMVRCLTCGQVGPDAEPRLEVLTVLTRLTHPDCIVCAEGGDPAEHSLGDS